MPDLNSTVGMGGMNKGDDVRRIKRLLNRQAERLRFAVLDDGPNLDGPTINAIKAFQRANLGMRAPDGLISPGDRTFRTLDGAGQAADAVEQAQGIRRKTRLSGAAWLAANDHRYPNSASIDDLTPAFAVQVRDFVGALRRAGAHVSVATTKRNRDRAFIMHWAWKVAHGEVAPNKVPRNPNVDIEWDHGNDKASRKAAEEMVTALHIAFQPSLASRHIDGLAIDMTITWDGPIKLRDRAGKDVAIDRPRNGARNEEVQLVGKSYGVVKLNSDPPHWSSDGH